MAEENPNANQQPNVNDNTEPAGADANREKQIKLANLGSGEYVGKGKFDSLKTV